MSESNDAPPPQDRPDEPSSSPFPESSLTPPPLPPEAEPPAPAPPLPEAPVPAPSFGVPTPVPQSPPPASDPPPSPAWMQPAEPQAAPPPDAPAGGLVSGDPLGGSPAPSSAPPFPAGYTSPPPPGAGGDFAAPPTTAAFGSGPAAGTYVLAGWWRRVGAALIDGVIIMVVALVIMIPLGIGVFSTAEVSETDTDFVGQIIAFVVGMLVVAAVALAYAPLMMGKTNGKTLGRMATGIRVVRADGQAITFGFAALREVAVKALLIGTVAGSFTFGLASLLDVLWPLWDDENRALHDFVVNTRTVMDS